MGRHWPLVHVTIWSSSSHPIGVYCNQLVCVKSRCWDSGPQMHWDHNLDLSESRDVNSHMTIRFAIGHFLLWSIGTKRPPPAVFKILGCKSIGVMTLTFQGHVTSSVTWQFNPQVVISYKCSTATMAVSLAVVEIMCSKYMGSWPWPF